MNERVAELWDGALTGDKYTQTQGALHRKEGGFCCLGVLCELHRLDTGKGSWRLYENADEDRDTDTSGKYHYVIEGGIAANESDSFLPREVMEWAGLEQEDPQVEMDDENEEIEVEVDDRTLSSLNDSGFTFRQIAALIRGQL